LILASGSPRRLELMRRIVPGFTSFVSTVEDTGSDREPDFAIPPLFLAPPFPVAARQDPRLWAWRKAVDIAENHGERFKPGTLVLGADTVVVGPGRLLGKPKDRRDALEMLHLLRGGPHYVVTGFVLLGTRVGGFDTLHHEVVISTVFMRDFTEDELGRYVATDEPYDKAGAYALQGEGGKLVASVEGCMNNVIGLPVCAVRRALAANGVRVLPYPYGGFCAHCPLVGG
jgi:nucleoside triphosphate pyrophosphatase